MSLSNVTIAVVIPFFNDSYTIERALRSLDHQVCPPSKIIIVNDSSSPNEQAMLERIIFSFKSIPITLINLPQNCGPSGARNIGMQNSDTDYIAFLDADDSWHREKLRLQRDFLSANPEIDLLGTQRKLNGVEADELGGEAGFNFVPIQKQLIRNRFATSSVIIKNDPRYRFNVQLRYSEDNDLWCRILLSGSKGAILQAPLTFFHKPLRSREGASGNYLRMYRGQISVYAGLKNDKLISPFRLGLVVSSATLRFIVRIFLVSIESFKRLFSKKKNGVRLRIQV